VYDPVLSIGPGRVAKLLDRTCQEGGLLIINEKES
jgi:hypothetical protein